MKMQHIGQFDTRREFLGNHGGIKAGKLFPAMITHVDFGESGRISQNLTLELRPVAGRLLTAVHADVQMIFVPAQAIEALRFPGDEFAGLEDVIRAKLLNGAALYMLAAGETPISQAARVIPTSVNGAKLVNNSIHVAYNAAVNWLRLRRYHKATLLPAETYTIQPAIVSETVLDRYNAVLDPDDRINGSVQLSIPDVRLPVDGLGTQSGGTQYQNVGSWETTGPDVYPYARSVNQTGAANNVYLETTAAGQAQLFAELNGVAAGAVSLSDFAKAEAKDRLFRKFDAVIEANPQYGEEMIARWVRGLSVEVGKTPMLLAERNLMFGKNMVSATDTVGVQNDTLRSDMALQVTINGIIPRSELGGIVVTLVTIRPDETVADQPHPFLARTITARNYAQDAMQTDPIPVTRRDIASDISSAQESGIAFFTGLHELQRTYISYGFNRLTNPTTVEHRTKIWQMELPLSVDPGNINYPENFPQYPFADQFGDCCDFSIAHTMTLTTPIVFGPTPIETIGISTDDNQDI